jgi:phage protein D
MSTVTLYQESLQRKATDGTVFYVPSFEVKIAGVGLPRDVLRDVIQISYKDDIKHLDSFELTVNNWDAATNQYKYIGSETEDSLNNESSPESLRFRLFEPCSKEVSVSMGYVGDLRLMLKGHFVSLDPTFPSSGPPTLTVRGLNVLHKLRNRPYTTTWENKKDSEIAENIATLRDRGKRRFPYTVTIDSNAKAKEPSIAKVTQQTQYDIDFLFWRARQRGYVVVVQESQGRQREGIFFGPSSGQGLTGLRNVTFKLEWGKSLIDFKPNLTTANRVSSVRVRGWNRTTRQRIEGVAELSDNGPNCDLYRLLCREEPREERIVNEPCFNQQQATQRAQALLDENLKNLVTCSGTTIGLPDLRAGQTVHIDGVGSRLSGIYSIDESTHTINESGYITQFKARREGSFR